MKGQPKEPVAQQPFSRRAGKPDEFREGSLGDLPEEESIDEQAIMATGGIVNAKETPHRIHRQKSRSFEFKTGVVWDDLDRSASIAFLPSKADEGEKGEISQISASPLMANRALYRRHRGMRLAVLEASKQFDKKRTDRQTQDLLMQAGLIMKRGAIPPVELEDAHTRALFDAASKRCGRSKRTRNKTVSDVTGMLAKSLA